MSNGPIIDHDPDEPKKGYKPVSWWLVWAIIAFCWWGYLSTHTFDWYAVAVGLGTGCMLATWAIEITGNKVPENWKSKSARRKRDAQF